MKELLQKLRKYEIQIRKAITSHLQGDFHSVFKGTGLVFEDVRAYQYGDDVRTIDWNVSAKGHGTFVRTYKEEKEQSVFFVLDVSASQEIGKPTVQKVDIGKEICGILTLSAIKQGSQVGLLCFSNQKELYLPANSGIQHGYSLLKSLFKLKPHSQKTSISTGLQLALSIVKRRSVIILLSDFIDEGYEKMLKAVAQRHDLIVVHLTDKRDINLPPLGIVPLFSKEQQKRFWINTSSSEFQTNYKYRHEQAQKAVTNICRKFNANYIAVSTNQDFVPALVDLFAHRRKRKKSV